MTYRNVAIIGKARSGKDTVAGRLVSRFAFTRLAFADPLKDAALSLDPLILTTWDVSPVRLSRLVADVGWEYAKDHYPEVRRTLQRMGQGVRDLDEDFWLNVTLDRVTVADTWNLPVVVSDVRYRNEADALRNRGFLLVRITRPPVARSMNLAQIQAAKHASETELDDYATDLTVANDGNMSQLLGAADELARKR
ncbi:hypothetical protein ACIBKZ_15630 [Streptomyces sp. NPDC050421]|uniref:deoxynucleotide monophosphate kinase family protein n=1 Tax=Streptomyces sp. NPDC050421 TaxID=3365613 RepID=UPI0037A46370